MSTRSRSSRPETASAAGLHKLTGDITEMAAQVPALFEALSGMPMSDLLSKVRKIGDKAPKPEMEQGARSAIRS